LAENNQTIDGKKCRRKNRPRHKVVLTRRSIKQNYQTFRREISNESLTKGEGELPLRIQMKCTSGSDKKQKKANTIEARVRK